jgi:hypothetical protein
MLLTGITQITPLRENVLNPLNDSKVFDFVFTVNAWQSSGGGCLF